jgi:hypothetical protein
LRIQTGERHLPQHISLGEDSRDTIVTVHNGDSPHVIIKHFVNGVSHASFHGDRSNFPVTKFQDTHKISSGLSEARSL